MDLIKPQPLKYKNLHKFFVSNKGYFSPFSPFVYDNSLNVFLLGARRDQFFYDMTKSFPFIKIGLSVLETSIAKETKILLCDRSDPLFFYSNLASNHNNNNAECRSKPAICLNSIDYFELPEALNLILLNYTFTSLQKLKAKNIGVVLIHNVGAFSMNEVESKNAPIIGVDCSTLKGVCYPFNATVEKIELFKWYLFTILNVFRRGLSRRKKKKNEI